MSLRFARAARVTAATRLASTTTRTDGSRFNVFTQRTTVEDLRVSFEIDKSLSPDSNKAKVTVYNLGKESRGIFQSKPANITLEVGYGSDLAQIYKGNVIHSTSRREGAEWMTILQLGTRYDAIRNARVNRSFKVGANPRQLVREAAGAMGLSLPRNLTEGRELFEKFSSGVVLEGLASDQLTKLLKPQGLGWSVQDDQLQILAANETNRTQAINISQELGMIGSPELGAPEEKGKPPVLTVRTLLEPDLVPGGVIVVKSRDISGDFRILKVRHTGDTHERPWYSDVEAKHL